jgi:hypothetical protein
MPKGRPRVRKCSKIAKRRRLEEVKRRLCNHWSPDRIITAMQEAYDLSWQGSYDYILEVTKEWSKTALKDVEERRARQIERLLAIASEAREASDKVAAERLLAKVEGTETATKMEVTNKDGLELLTVEELKSMMKELLSEGKTDGQD